MHLPITPRETDESCLLLFTDPNFRPNVKDFPFDLQTGKPGDFIVPGVIDLETYREGWLVQFSWLYFKGDPFEGPQPGHPFVRPFNNSVEFSLDVVDAEDSTTVVRSIMSPTNSTPFWNGGGPFGNNGAHVMDIYRLHNWSCEFYTAAVMSYRWTVPEDVEKDVDFRLKLSTKDPATAHVSGKWRVTGPDYLPSSWMMSKMGEAGKQNGVGPKLVLLSLVPVLLILMIIICRWRRASGHIILK